MAHSLENNTMLHNSSLVGGKKPWHGLGNDIAEDVKAGLTPLELVAKYGYDWLVNVKPLFAESGVDVQGNAVFEMLPGTFGAFRSTDNKFFGSTGKNWKPVQNTQVAEFFNAFCGEGGATIDTVGSLKEGQIFWMQADLGQNFVLPGGDVVKGRLLASNRHKPGEAMRIAVVQERVVCNNTLRIAEKETGNLMVRFHHGSKFDEKAQEYVRNMLNLQRKAFDDYAQLAQVLANTKISEGQAVNSVIKLFGDEMETVSNQPRTVKTVLDLFNGGAMGSELTSSNGTAWGLLNAITEYTDHHAGHGRDTALTSAWFGQNATVKNNALELVKDLAGVV